jgi:hypothetical protein
MATKLHIVKDADVVNDVFEGPLPITGNDLSYIVNRLDRIGRAFVAADLYSGACYLIKPTLKQAAWLAHVNYSYAHWAVKRYAQRKDILAGLLPLVPPFTPKSTSIITPETVTDAELADVIRKAGISRTLDVAAMVEAAE